MFSACRDGLYTSDLKFIADTLDESGNDHLHIESLITDKDCRDVILDSDALFDRLVGANIDMLSVSTRFYFYTMIRHSMLTVGIDDTDTTDYVAEVMHGFCKREMKDMYAVDLLNAYRDTGNEYQSFVKKSFVGDYFLFVTSVFHEFIVERERKHGAPGIEFYDRIGGDSYLEASRMDHAKTLGVDNILGFLGGNFKETRECIDCVMTSANE